MTVPSAFDMCVMATSFVAVGQALLEFLDVEDAVVVDRHPDELRALPLADEMPRHDVGMMLHDREHDLVARADVRHAPAIGDRVDRLGRMDLVKTISSTLPAFRKRRTVSRAFS